MSSAAAVALKYFEVARVSLKSKVAYWAEQLLSTIFLVSVVLIFSQLWRTTFSSTGEAMINGYSYPQMVWYIVITEGIILSLPRVHFIIESEVRNGDIAIRLNKPYQYLAFHFFSCLGEGLFRLALITGVGGLTAAILVGPVDFHWPALPALLILYVTTIAMHFFYNSWIGLAAFWTEDVSGIYFVLDRLKWILGGFFFPVEIFPVWLQQVMRHLPFQYMIYAPARMALKFSWQGLAELFAAQAGWLVLLGGVAYGLYALGVRRVDVNGG